MKLLASQKRDKRVAAGGGKVAKETEKNEKKIKTFPFD